MDKIKKYIKSKKNLDKAKDFDQFFDKNYDLVRRNAGEALHLISGLDISENTVGIAYILGSIYRIRDIGADKGLSVKGLIYYTKNFIYSANVEQLKESSFYLNQFYFLVEIFSYSLCFGESERLHWGTSNCANFHIGKPMIGIKPIKKAIQNLQSKPTDFTPLHPYFALLCISAKAYRHALPIIEHKTLAGFSHGYNDHLNIMNYNYYRGLIHTALENYDEAKHCFKLVIDTPYQLLHVIQIAAFKKFALLTWLTSTHNINDDDHKAVRFEIKSAIYSKGLLGKQLEEICEEYLRAESINNFFVYQNHEELEKDTNMGLVKQVIKKIRNEVIESLTQTNTMLEIKEIEGRLEHHRKLCGVIEEEQKVRAMSEMKDSLMEDVKMEESVYEDEDLSQVMIKMVKTGRIRAKINMEKQTAFFEDEDVKMKDLVKKLEEQNAMIIDVLKEVENTDKDLLFQKKLGQEAEGGDVQMEYDDMMMNEF